VAHRAVLAVLLLATAVLFTANMAAPSLASLEDAFYAREAVEMKRAGRFFTVTWREQPTYQHPPLHIWLVGRAFALFGENDFAARLPTVLMALGLLLLVYRLGAQLVGSAAARTGIACLLATPLFVDNARRVMMEVPLTFWITLTILLFVEGRERPWLHALLGLPLGAAMLTKSVLGLMPVWVFVGALVCPDLRRGWARPWIWLGVAFGLVIGLSWPMEQALGHGLASVHFHYVEFVMGRSSGRWDVLSLLFGYPLILLRSYQPVVILGFLGVFLVLRRRGLRDPAVLLAAWVLLPVALYSLSSFRTPRFLFPILPALALCAGYGLAETFPRAAARIAWPVAPVMALVVASVIWITPSLLGLDPNAAFKRDAARLRAEIPSHESVPYLGKSYWSSANPLLYYAERILEPSSVSAAEAVQLARSRGARLLLCDRSRLAEVDRLGIPFAVTLEDPRWVLIRVPPI
jgi:4-amino-4-deoxy-L-arabinose transferase-like glycosyltransferase